MTLQDYQTLFAEFSFENPAIQSNIDIYEENSKINFNVRVNGDNLDSGLLPSIIGYPNDIVGPIIDKLSTFSTEDENGWIIPLFDISIHTPEIYKVFNQDNTHISSFTYRWENSIVYWEFLEV
jgi:hypothetical protein